MRLVGRVTRIRLRMRRIPVGDTGGQRQVQHPFTPTLGPANILSADAEAYVNQAAALQRQAVTDPALNGTDNQVLGGTDV
jgi:hypothetical protein